MIGVTNIVAKRETFLPAIDRLYGDQPYISISPRHLATLGYKHRHQYTEIGMIRRTNRNYAKWPRDLFWPQKDGIAVRALFLHPLCASAEALQQDLKLNYKWVDYHFTASLFPRKTDFPKLKVLNSSEEVYINDCTTENRVFPTTGRPYDPALVAKETSHAKALHRWILQQPQFIACDGVKVTSDRDPDEDTKQLLALIEAEAED